MDQRLKAGMCCGQNSCPFLCVFAGHCGWYCPKGEQGRRAHQRGVCAVGLASHHFRLNFFKGSTVSLLDDGLGAADLACQGGKSASCEYLIQVFGIEIV